MKDWGIIDRHAPVFAIGELEKNRHAPPGCRPPAITTPMITNRPIKLRAGNGGGGGKVVSSGIPI
jgi:hypothetical protein